MTPRMTRRTLLGGILGLCGGIPFVALADDEVIVPPGEEESGCFDAEMNPVDCEPPVEDVVVEPDVTPCPTAIQYIKKPDGNGGYYADVVSATGPDNEYEVISVAVAEEVDGSHTTQFTVVALPRTGVGR